MTGSRHPSTRRETFPFRFPLLPAALSRTLPRAPGTGSAATGPVPALRAATRSHHERVDRLIDLPRLRERAHYARVLQVLDAFLGTWETRAGAALPAAWQGWLQLRSRRPFLQQDLRVLGVAALPPPPALPALASAAAAWGSIYVIEGSALGGQLVSRSLAQAGLHPHSGAAYFHGWGEATGRMWSEARAVLDLELAEPERLAQACHAARATFDALSHLLETLPHERAAAA